MMGWRNSASPARLWRIVQDGEIVYSQGFGVTGKGGDTPITPQTHMMIGSTGKSLTTMLMGTLVDEGEMNWDTPAIDVLPQFAVSDPELTASITLRNLVCACTGVPRRDFELFFNADELSAEDIVASLATFQFFTDFGEAFQYSNQLVGTGGYAAAAADGAQFGNLFDGYSQSLQDNVLTQIGMTNTTLSFAEVRGRNDYAIPHSVGLDGAYEALPLEFEEILVPIAPAGSHWSTLEDMTRYLLTELAVGVAPNGTRVISEENLRETWEPQVPVSADTSYGLGWFVSDYKGLQLIDHGGNTLGFTSSFGFLPEVDLGIIVLTNGQGTNYFNTSVRARLLELLFDQEPEAAATMQFAYEQLQSQFEMTERLRDQVDPATVEPYLATFTNPALGSLELRLEDNVLIADVGEFAVPLVPLEEEDEPETLAGYVATEAPITGLLFELTENDAGEPVVEFGQGAVAYTFEQDAP
jgi:CubicO group peptidase (beta-lactamase class C family)